MRIGSVLLSNWASDSNIYMLLHDPVVFGRERCTKTKIYNSSICTCLMILVLSGSFSAVLHSTSSTDNSRSTFRVVKVSKIPLGHVDNKTKESSVISSWKTQSQISVTWSELQEEETTRNRLTLSNMVSQLVVSLWKVLGNTCCDITDLGRGQKCSTLAGVDPLTAVFVSQLVSRPLNHQPNTTVVAAEQSL